MARQDVSYANPKEGKDTLIASYVVGGLGVVSGVAGLAGLCLDYANVNIGEIDSQQLAKAAELVSKHYVPLFWGAGVGIVGGVGLKAIGKIQHWRAND